MHPGECSNWKPAIVLAVCAALAAASIAATSAADKADQTNATGIITAQSQAPAAPGQPEADKKTAERALERTLVSTGALLLPLGQADIEPGFSYIRSEQRAPVVFTSGGASVIAEQQVNSDIVGAVVQLRIGLPADAQVEFNVPYSHVTEETVTEVGFQPQARTTMRHSGMGDVSVALAKALLVERGWRPNLVARLTWDSDTGKTELNGSGFNEARISLVATQRQDPLVFLWELSYQKAFEKDGVKPGDEAGLSFGALLAASPETSLRVVLNQIFVSDIELGGSSLPGSRTVASTLTFGASSIIGAGKFLDFTVQTGLTDAAPAYAFGVALAMRFGAPR
jgi:hypothetical protein